MTTVTVKVDLPDGWELACDHMRSLNYRETGLTGQNELIIWTLHVPSNDKYVIVRKSWQWPEWLTCAAVVRTKQGEVWACATVPWPDECMASGWCNTGTALPLSDKFVHLDYPEGPWRDSRRLNPNRKDEA
jgi:hypothetical protein